MVHVRDSLHHFHQSPWLETGRTCAKRSGMNPFRPYLSMGDFLASATKPLQQSCCNAPHRPRCACFVLRSASCSIPPHTSIQGSHVWRSCKTAFPWQVMPLSFFLFFFSSRTHYHSTCISTSISTSRESRKSHAPRCHYYRLQ